jgi:hypothetical protein
MAESHTMPAMRPGNQRGGPGQWLALAGTAVAVAVVVALLVSWPSHGSKALDIAPATPNAAAAPDSGATSAKPNVRVHVCDPIFGGGVAHRVTSSASDGAPAGCGMAHSVLLASLNAVDNRIGGWHCVSRPNGRTLAACTSMGGRRIVARN